MIQTDLLSNILKETAEMYEGFIRLEYDKYDAVITDNTARLDEIISIEQAFFLKMRGLEQKRQKITKDMNMQDKTLKQILELAQHEEKAKLKVEHERLLKALNDFKKINSECKSLIEVKLHKINSCIEKKESLGSTYTNNDNKINNGNKNYFISRKI